MQGIERTASACGFGADQGAGHDVRLVGDVSMVRVTSKFYAVLRHGLLASPVFQVLRWWFLAPISGVNSKRRQSSRVTVRPLGRHLR